MYQPQSWHYAWGFRWLSKTSPACFTKWSILYLSESASPPLHDFQIVKFLNQAPSARTVSTVFCSETKTGYSIFDNRRKKKEQIDRDTRLYRKSREALQDKTVSCHINLGSHRFTGVSVYGCVRMCARASVFMFNIVTDWLRGLFFRNCFV